MIKRLSINIDDPEDNDIFVSIVVKNIPDFKLHHGLQQI